MVPALFGLSDLEEALPQLDPLRLFPAVVSLKYRDYVLARRVKDLAESLNGWFHAMSLDYKPPVGVVSVLKGDGAVAH